MENDSLLLFPPFSDNPNWYHTSHYVTINPTITFQNILSTNLIVLKPV